MEIDYTAIFGVNNPRGSGFLFLEDSKRKDLKMTGNLAKDWLVYVLIAGMFWFFTYMIIVGNKGTKDDKRGQEKNKQDKEV